MFQETDDYQESLQSLAMAAGPRGMGLSKPHKPARTAATISAPVVQTPPQLCYAAGASYAKVSRGGSKRMGGGKRGAVHGQSAESRKRHQDLLNQIPRSAWEDALFLTLTYCDGVKPEAAKVHRDIECLAARLKRLYPKVAIPWKLEPKVRKSGAHAGRVYFHFHLITFGVKFIDKNWLSKAWYEIVGSGDKKHLRAGTQVQRLKSSRQGLMYLSKYVSKNELAETGLSVLVAALQTFSLPVVLQWWKAYASTSTGRTWGCYWRENLPISLVYVELSLSDFFSFRRLLRHYVAQKCKWRKRRVRDPDTGVVTLVTVPGIRVRYRSDEFSGATAWISDSTSLRLLMAG